MHQNLQAKSIINEKIQSAIQMIKNYENLKQKGLLTIQQEIYSIFESSFSNFYEIFYSIQIQIKKSELISQKMPLIHFYNFIIRKIKDLRKLIEHFAYQIYCDCYMSAYSQKCKQSEWELKMIFRLWSCFFSKQTIQKIRYFIFYSIRKDITDLKSINDTIRLFELVGINSISIEDQKNFFAIQYSPLPNLKLCANKQYGFKSSFFSQLHLYCKSTQQIIQINKDRTQYFLTKKSVPLNKKYFLCQRCFHIVDTDNQKHVHLRYHMEEIIKSKELQKQENGSKRRGKILFVTKGDWLVPDSHFRNRISHEQMTIDIKTVKQVYFLATCKSFDLPKCIFCSQLIKFEKKANDWVFKEVIIFYLKGRESKTNEQKDQKIVFRLRENCEQKKFLIHSRCYQIVIRQEIEQNKWELI